MNRVTLLMFGFVVALGWGYYMFLYPPRQLRVAIKNALEEFAQAVATKDRSKVGAVVDGHLTDNAKIHLEVTFFSLTQKGQIPIVEDFTKKDFMTFIDNVLYPLDTYAYTPTLESFTMNDAHSAADIVFSSREWADGKSHYAGIEVGVRFSSDTVCEGHVVFSGKVPFMDTLSCKISMRTVPKPEEASKLRGNPQAMQQFLMR